MVSFILPGNSATGGYEVANSCRFNAGSSDSLTRTFGTPTNNKIWTYSFWMKHCDNAGVLLNTGADTSYMYFRGSSANPVPFGFSVEQYVSSFQYKLIPNEVFRDHSAWQHIVIAFDTTQSTASNRVKIYKNGSQITSFNTEDYPSQNLDTQVNSAVAHKIGGFASSGFYDGYLAEVVFIDGQQLAPTSFGEFDSDSPNIWKPINVSGLTFGNNGFYLDFENASSLGADVSGNGNNFTVGNLTSVDQSTDTCTNNFATMNPLNLPTSNQPTFSEGNLKTVTSSSGSGRFGGSTTFGVSQGKWYVEAKATVGSTYSRNCIGVSYNPSEMARNNSDNTLTHVSYAWGWDSSDGKVYHDSSNIVNYASYTTGDICQIFLDLDNHKLYFGKNGTLQSSTGIDLDSGETYFIAQVDRTGTSEVSTFEFNFGSPSYSISSGNTDGEYGNFEYSTTITGDGASKTFKALNSKNLAEFG